MNLSITNQQSNKRAICIGGANIDRKIFLKEKPVVGTSNPVIEKTAFGGVARNITENLARLNVNVSLLSIVGNDAAADSLLAFMAQHIDTSPIYQTSDYATGTYSALIEPSGDMYIGLAAMEICNLMNAAWLNQNKHFLEDKDWLICDLNVMPDGVQALIDYANSKAKNLAIIGVSSPKMRHLPVEIDGVELGIFNIDESQARFDTDMCDPIKLAEKLSLPQALSHLPMVKRARGLRKCQLCQLNKSMM